MNSVLVIRFGALGDLCLVGWTLTRLVTAAERTAGRITLVTKARFAALAREFRGIDRVIPLAEPGRAVDLWRLARELRTDPDDLVIDAHRVLRSRLLAGLLGRSPHVRLRKDTTARLRLLRTGEADPRLSRHLRDRLDALLDDVGLTTGEATPPLAHLAPELGRPAVLGLAPGAQWDPKRWPVVHWVALLERGLASGVRIRLFVGPREEAWFEGSDLARATAGVSEVETVRGASLTEVARELAACRTVVCNDSGLLHLAEATGTPVLAFFGPTVRAFGYTPQLEQSRLLERHDLDCRPCSRNGKRPCHRGDLACLVRIEPDTAWQALRAMPAWQEELA
ncbi:hypothetical protein GF314_13365 [bacterium]|nr:hypothetical protein [bacterium]